MDFQEFDKLIFLKESTKFLLANLYDGPGVYSEYTKKI